MGETKQVNDLLARATINFQADIAIWGCSLWGNSEPATLVAEDRGSSYWHRGALWDTMGPTDWVRSMGDDAYEPVPLRWSLPYVQEMIWKRP